MIKNFQKKVISGEMDREVTSKSRNTKHLTEPTRTKAESTKPESMQRTQATETKDLNSDLQYEGQETANQSDSSTGKKDEIKTDKAQKEESEVVIECTEVEEPVRQNNMRNLQEKRSSSIPLRRSQIEGLEECIYQIEEEDS